MKIRFLTFTSLKYFSCLLCYLGIYRKPVIRETYSDIMKWTTIWQFPFPAGHCHSTGSTCNNCTYILVILEAQVEMILVAMTSYAWAFRNYQLTSLRMFWYACNSHEESLGIKGPRVTIHHRKEGDGVDVTPPAHGKISMLLFFEEVIAIFVNHNLYQQFSFIIMS
jgi:hypothetical protein